MEDVQKSSPTTEYVYKGISVPGVSVDMSYSYDKSVGHRYERVTKLTELQGTGMRGLLNLQNM